MTKYHIKEKINLSDIHTIFDIVTYINSVINIIGFNTRVTVFIHSLGHRSSSLMLNFLNKSFLTLAHLARDIKKILFLI
jgi:hypothetical protein